MTEDKAPVARGEIVANKYRVDRIIGAGGMGIVVAATQLELDRPVAIKFLTADAAKVPDVVARFSREARAVARIQGEHVARVLDVGVLGDGLPYMVMEYLEGSDLAQRIAREGRLPLADVARYVLEACEALAEAHAAGIIHRDLKPGNLFLARRPDQSLIVKLLDFGISKSPLKEGPGVTSTQALMGSPLYMSPEQLVSAKSVDVRSDIWSLGIVLYEALAGIPPFNADTMPQIVTRILHTPAPRLMQERPDLPPPIDAIVARCLEKDPSARFGDVAELASALAPFVEDGARAVGRITRVLGRIDAPPAPLLDSARPSADSSGAVAQQLPSPRRVGPWIAATVLGVCGVLGAAALAVRALRHTEPPVPSTVTRVTPMPDSPPASATAVKLAPPAERPIPRPAIPTNDPAGIATRSLPAAAHGRPTAGTATTATTAAAPSAATPAPASTPEPVADPLHMGIK